MRGPGLLGAALLLAFAAGCPSTPATVTAPEVKARTLTEEEEKVCREFIRLKNAKDPAANDLLGPAAVIPDEPVSPEEAQRLQTEAFLRGDYEITDVWSRPATAGSPTTPIILVTKGAFEGVRLKIKTPSGVDVVTRSMAHPDLIVEVRDGKIHGVRADLHSDPNERPLTKIEAERLRRMLGITP